ncbi:hypothetical protein [Nonomuraea dietziae]|uniref:hypothetical protein n=1 Tax=Nonomuraea dietziae TaxID=65515 RepID=UPI0031CE43D5
MVGQVASPGGGQAPATPAPAVMNQLGTLSRVRTCPPVSIRRPSWSRTPGSGSVATGMIARSLSRPRRCASTHGSANFLAKSIIVRSSGMAVRSSMGVGDWTAMPTTLS